MYTEIKKVKRIETDDGKSHYYVIYFDYIDHNDAFTYLSKKSIVYWKSRGLKKIFIGQKINVFKVHNTNSYKIVSFGEYKDEKK